MIGDSTTGFVAHPQAIHQAIRFLLHSLLPMMPGTRDSLVDLIATDYAVGAVSHLAHERFIPGRTFHLCAGADALRQEALIDLLLDTILESRPAWRRRAIEKPVIVGLETFELSGSRWTRLRIRRCARRSASSVILRRSSRTRKCSTIPIAARLLRLTASSDHRLIRPWPGSCDI